MRELDCDFCGSPAAGAYEVGPKPPDRSPTDRRRLVLCADCRETLAVAIQPLLDRVAAAESDTSAGEGGAADTELTNEDGMVNAESTDDGEETGPDERIVSNEEQNTERLTGTDDTTHPSEETTKIHSETTETESETEETESAPTETGSESTQTGHTATDPRRNGTADHSTGDSGDDEWVSTTTPPESPGTDDTDDDSQSGKSAADETEDEVVSEGQTDRGDSHASNQSGTSGGASESRRTGGEPPQFRRVMRLLNNRTFPVDRAEFTDLATGAYELAESEVDRIVEYAVQRGVLTVEDGELRRG